MSMPNFLPDQSPDHFKAGLLAKNNVAKQRSTRLEVITKLDMLASIKYACL
jgi:hypothetical protein